MEEEIGHRERRERAEMGAYGNELTLNTPLLSSNI